MPGKLEPVRAGQASLDLYVGKIGPVCTGQASLDLYA